MVEKVAAPPRFEMGGVRKTFGATVALDGVDFAVRSGEVCALVGQNGAGKSTLMGILAGALKPDAGVMRVAGAPYAPRHPLDARKAGVAMIHQELSLAPHLTVMENIVLGVEPTRFGVIQRDRMRETAAAALIELGHPDISPDAVVGDLSPAGQQLVEIARAIASGCRMLVLDEPTSSLAHADVRRLFDLIGRLKQRGHAIVYISHFIEEVKEVSDRFVVLRDGRNAGEGVTAQTRADDIVGLMVGRALEDLYPRSTRSVGDVILEVEDLVPGSAAFTLHRGEVLGIAGLLGAGRTRLLRTIFGLEPVKSGRIRIAAYSGAAAPHQRWRQGMGMLSENRGGEGLARTLSVADNMTMTRLDSLGPGPIVWPARQDAAAARWIDRLAIRCSGPRQPVADLSGGNQQKVAFARLLHHDVDVFILDEPTRGIDVGSKAQIYKLIDELVSDMRRDGLKTVPYNRSDANRSDANRSDANRSDDNRSDANRSDANRSDANRSEDNRSEANRSDANRSDANRSDVARDTMGVGARDTMGIVGDGLQAVPRRARAVLLVSSYLPELLGVCDRIAVMSRGRLGPARPVSEWTEHALLMEASGARAAS